MSNRRITNIQFADGVVIAGDSLDAAWEAVKRRFDALELQDLDRQWFETRMVFGYEPRRNDWEDGGPGTGHIREFPWLNLETTITTPPVSQFKGAAFPGISPPNYGTGYVWALGWHSGPRPQALSAVDLCMSTSPATGVYPTGWRWSGHPPGEIQVDDFVEDCGFEIIVDHPTSPGDPAATGVLVYRAGLDVSCQYQSSAPSFLADMAPAHPSGTGGFEGVWLHAEGLHLPIPPEARVRLLLMVPDYLQAVDDAGNPIAPGDVRWRTTINSPWSLQCYSGSVTVLLPRGEG